MSSVSSIQDSTRPASELSEVALLRPLTFTQPTRIEYGLGKARQLGALVQDWPNRRVLVLADPFNAGRAGPPGRH